MWHITPFRPPPYRASSSPTKSCLCFSSFFSFLLLCLLVIRLLLIVVVILRSKSVPAQLPLWSTQEKTSEFESHFEHFFQKKCFRVRVVINTSPWVPRIWIEVWVCTYGRIRRPVDRYVTNAAVPRGGKCCKAYPGLGNRSIFYPGSSVGSTITYGWYHRECYTRTRRGQQGKSVQSAAADATACDRSFYVGSKPSSPLEVDTVGNRDDPGLSGNDAVTDDARWVREVALEDLEGLSLIHI